MVYVIKSSPSRTERRNTPVVVIPGTNDNKNTMRPLLNACINEGFLVVPFWYTNDLSVPLTTLLGKLESWLGDLFFDEGDYQQVHLVGMSMGGLLAAAYIQLLNQSAKVRSFVNIAGPLQGTRVAYLSGAPGARDMRPDSEFIARIKATQGNLSLTRCTTIRTPMDLMIIPSESSCIPRADNRVVLNPGHGWLLRDPRVHRIVVDALLAAS